MSRIKSSFLALFSLSLGAFAQEGGSTPELQPQQPKISYLDSIKATFVEHKIATCVDSLWMNELANSDLYAELSNDIRNINLDEKVDYDLSTELLKKRLKEMDAKSPFNIEYNPALENLIKSFLKNRKKAYERLMALSEYYFPVFEEALAKYNVPLEIKYLAIVESALNPKAVSRVGATGLWQFMYQTGKEYNLDIDSYVDERSDPLKASDAAARYMSNMYKIFGDWDLVLASYNSGPGNVAKAIRRSGGQENFWNIRRNLPKETQGYVPAFLATMYIYTYHKEHGIVPNRAIIKHFGTDTVAVRRQITFKQLSDLLDVPVSQLQLLNPSYKLNTIPAYTDELHYLRLPVDKIGVFTSNEDKIYAYVDHEAARRERPFYQYTQQRDSARLASRRDSTSTKTEVADLQYHTVRRGETLGKISQRYGVSITQLKKWNRLRSNSAPLGRKLRIYSEAREDNTAVAATVPQSEKNDKPVVATNPKETETTKPDVYVVQKGDNLSSIARKFGITVAELKEWNNLQDNNVMLDARLKLKGDALVAENTKTEPVVPSTSYIVQKGDNLSLIARKYGVSVAEIQEWNAIEGNSITVGSKLLILKENPKNEVAAAQKDAARQKHYLVKKGDSLFTIAKKSGVTVSDIKRWNGIKGDELQPGMKLKISG